MEPARVEPVSSQAVPSAGLPLRRYLARLIALSMLPLVVLAFGLSLHHAHTLEQERALAAQQLLRQVTLSLDQLLRERIHGLQVLALSPTLGDAALRAAQWDEAIRYRSIYGTDVILADLNHNMLFNSRVPLGTELPPLPRPKGRSAVTEALQSGSPAVGDIFEGPFAHHKLVAMAVPVKRAGAAAYFLITTMQTQQLQYFLESEPLPEGWSLTILDSQDSVIAHNEHIPEDEGVFPPEAYSFRQNLTVAPWSVHIKIAQAAYQAPLVHAGVGLAFALAIAICIAAWTSWRASERIDHAVSSLGQQTSTHAAAPLIAEVEIVRTMLQRSDASRDAAVEALRVSEEQLRHLNAELSATLQAIPDLLFDLDQEGRYIGIWAHNPDLLSRQQSRLLGKTVHAVMPVKEADTVMQALHDAGQTGASFGKVIELELPDGTHWFELSVTRKDLRPGELNRFIVLSRDITERMRSQKALAESEFRWKFAVEGAGAGLWDWDVRKGTLYLSTAWKALVGYAEDEIGNSTDEWESRLHPQDHARALAALRACMDGTTPHYMSEHRFLAKDGNYRWMSDRGMVVSRDAKGNPLRMIGMLMDVTHRKNIELELEKSEATLRAIADNVNIILFLKDRSGRYLYINRQYENVFGIQASDLLGHTDHVLFPTDVADELGRNDRMVAESGQSTEFEEQLMVGDTLHTYMSVKIPVRDAQGHIYAVCGIATDITQRKQAEVDLRIAAAAFESQEGMMVTDANSVILRVNRAFTEITGYSEEEIVGKTPRLLQSGRHDAEFYQEMWETVARTGSWQGEVWDRRKNGEEYQKWLNISAVVDDQGKVTHYVGTHYDISERKKAEETIKDLAFYDPLTRLPNRTLLHDRLKQALTSSHRTGACGAVLFIDLDHFKNLNDTLGHDTGDLLLKQVAQRISACVREGDTVARLGGDEFVVVLENLSSNAAEAANQTEVIGSKILAELNQKYRLGTVDHRSTASMGATIFQGHDASIEDLLKQADLAMYKSKDSGRNVLRFFDPNMQSSVMQRAELENDMHEALQHGQFVLYYQAQVDQGQITGAEVLVRWMHPQRGMVAPGQFIALAEETGLIVPLGNWVLATACRQLAAWVAHPVTAQWNLSVNVSVQQFRQPDFVQQVLQVLEQTGANAQRLKLELTESMLVDRVDDVVEKMMALKSCGVGFSLDDFGTGYSSLAYLRRLPLDQLKIDQSFVRDVLVDPNDATIAQTIVALAHSLGIGVIAEGVETQLQRDFLARAGCHAYQGYFFSRPVPLTEFEAFALGRSDASGA